MVFKRAVQRYGRTPEPETPFQRAGQMWDDRIGSARVQARNWRLMALGNLAMATALAGGLVWQSQQSRVAPYVVEIDRFGEARAVAPADKDYRPTDPQIAWHLGRFVASVRTVSLDPVLMREAWLSAYDFATPRASQFLGDYARSSDPFARVGERSVSVQITSVVRASDRSFQVKWTESVFERGALAATSRWTAMLTIIVKPPRTAEVLRKNPLGVYVEAIDWSREFEAAPTGDPATRAPVEMSPATQASPKPPEAPASSPVSTAPVAPRAGDTPALAPTEGSDR
jgi:type IV secretion system protein TrbF